MLSSRVRALPTPYPSPTQCLEDGNPVGVGVLLVLSAGSSPSTPSFEHQSGFYTKSGDEGWSGFVAQGLSLPILSLPHSVRNLGGIFLSTLDSLCIFPSQVLLQMRQGHPVSFGGT